MNPLDLKLDEQLGTAFDAKLDELIAARIELASDGVTNFKAVSPAAKEKLKGLLKYYAKKPHPFTACVNDNRKRFGPRAENVCAVLKDMIRGTTKWRGKGNPNDKGNAGIAGMAEQTTILMDEETAYLIEQLAELDLWELMGLAELEDDGLKLAYPMEPQIPEMGEKDHAFLDHLKKHHSKHLTVATKYLTDDPHPQVAGMARDAVSEATNGIHRANNMKKTGRPYGY